MLCKELYKLKSHLAWDHGLFPGQPIFNNWPNSEEPSNFRACLKISWDLFLDTSLVYCTSSQYFQRVPPNKLLCANLFKQIIYLFLLIISLLFYYSCPSFSPFAFLHPAYPLLPQSIPHSCPCPWVTHTCSLTSMTCPSSPSFRPYPSLPSPWLLSVCSLFPCFWFYFVHLFVLFIRFLL